MVGIIEQNYDVKVETVPEQAPSLGVYRVSLEEAVKRVFMLEMTECMPWQEVEREGESANRHIHRLIKLADTIKSIDHYLKRSHRKMEQEDRQAAIN